MVKVVVPRVGRQGPTEFRLRDWGVHYEWREVDATYAYAKMLTDLWREGEGFLLLEHDVVPTSPEQLTEIRTCPKPWCAAPYISPVMMLGMGVTKLTDEALAASQDIPEVFHGMHWSTIDSKLIPALESRFPLHGHFPPFDHQRQRAF